MLSLNNMNKSRSKYVLSDNKNTGQNYVGPVDLLSDI